MRINEPLLSRRFKYLHLIDYEKKFSVPRSPEFGLLYFRIWLEDGINFYWQRDPAFYPNLFALNLISTRGTRLSLGNSDTPGHNDQRKQCLEEILLKEIYRVFELHTIQKLKSLEEDNSAEASLILSKWVKVFNVLQFGKNRSRASAFKKTILREMLCHGVTDGTLVIDLLEATCLTRKDQRRVLTYINYGPDREEERLVIEGARQRRFQFWGFWCRDLVDKSQSVRFCPSLEALFYGNEALSCLLNDYGFQVDLRPMSKKTWLHNYNWIISRLSSPPESLPEVFSHRIVLICVLTRTMLAPYMLYLAVQRRKDEEETIPEEITPEERRRQRLLSRNAEDTLERYVQCLRFLWRSIPTPYIGREEYVNAFETVLGIPEIHMDHWRNFYNIYESIIPEFCGGQMAPRSLMHQCRCVIRNRLHMNWMMPQGIQQLGIPQRIKDYLMLEW